MLGGSDGNNHSLVGVCLHELEFGTFPIIGPLSAFPISVKLLDLQVLLHQLRKVFHQKKFVNFLKLVV